MGYSGRKAWALAGATLLGLGGLLAAVRARVGSDPAELAAATRLALKDRRWSRAEDLLARLARRRPPTVDDVALRAELELGRGRADRAVGLLTAIAEDDPHAARARLVAGQIEKSRNRARRMEALFREAVRLDPGLVLPRRELILLYAMQARRSDLNEQFGALSALEPLEYDDVLLWTASLEDIWINETIRARLEGYLVADPEDRSSRLGLAMVLVGSNELEGAEALLRPLPDSDPDARVLRVRIALGRSRLDEVRSLLDAGPAEHVGLALLRGQLAVRMGDPAAAARQFRIALRGDPTNREALQGLSLVFRRLGQADQAAVYRGQVARWRILTTWLEKARDSRQGRLDPDLVRHLGEACEDVDRPAEARAWYRLALRFDPTNPVVQRAVHRLRDRSP